MTIALAGFGKVVDVEDALRTFRVYRQREAVEDSFKFIKNTLGWEEVQLLDLDGVRTRLVLGWVATCFLYNLGITLEWEDVQLLTCLGSTVSRKDRKSGKATLTRGLHRLIDMPTINSFPYCYIADHGALPPHIAALLGQPTPEILTGYVRLGR